MGVLDRPSASTEALVLRAWPCGETSAVASLLTRDHGFVKVIAKAARRPHSRLRALVEPGRLVNVEFSLNEGRELQYLRGGGVDRDALGDEPTLERSAYLLGALELVDRCRPAGALLGTAAGDLFEVCTGFFGMLDSAACPDPARAFFAFEWALLGEHGVPPQVDRCVACGGEDPAAPGTRFSPAEGGRICPSCPGDGQALSSAAADVLCDLARGGEGPALERAVRREVGGHLHRFLGYHLPGYRLPAALDLLRAGKDRSR